MAQNCLEDKPKREIWSIPEFTVSLRENRDRLFRAVQLFLELRPGRSFPKGNF